MKYQRNAIVVAFCFAASLTFAQMDPVIDDASMARLRLANLVFGSGDTDMYVDGRIIVLGSSEQVLSGWPVGWIPGFLYLEPGTHTAAIVPTGKPLDEAMIALEVTLEPGHRYTVAAMGQREDGGFTPLVIDETAALATARTSPEQGIMILVNNQAGIETITFDEDGVGPRDVPYGGFVAAPIRTGHVDQLVVTAMTDEGNVTLDFGDTDFYELPGVDFIIANLGRYPGSYGADNVLANTVNTVFQSDLNPLELLGQFEDIDVVWHNSKLSFDTFLSAVETAGLGEVLTTGTHLIFAPIDAAFEAMPAEQLEALMAEPGALAEFLRYHIVEGYYPRGTLSVSGSGNFADITLTTMQGGDLVLRGEAINGVDNPILVTLLVANGTRVAPITSVLLPPSP